jgi:hypothetical protein
MFPSNLPIFLPFCTSSPTVKLPISPLPEHYSQSKPPLIAAQTPSAAAASKDAAIHAHQASAKGPAASNGTTGHAQQAATFSEAPHLAWKCGTRRSDSPIRVL